MSAGDVTCWVLLWVARWPTDIMRMSLYGTYADLSKLTTIAEEEHVEFSVSHYNNGSRVNTTTRTHPTNGLQFVSFDFRIWTSCYCLFVVLSCCYNALSPPWARSNFFAYRQIAYRIGLSHFVVTGIASHFYYPRNTSISAGGTFIRYLRYVNIAFMSSVYITFERVANRGIRPNLITNMNIFLHVLLSLQLLACLIYRETIMGIMGVIR